MPTPPFPLAIAIVFFALILNCLVTGGAGFIGSHLVDSLLNENINVTVLDDFSTGRPENLDHVREEIELIEYDLGMDRHLPNKN